MDENNPLFDLCKIKIELLFLNENISNLKNYENDLIFYLNKYLWKIQIDNSIFITNKEEDEPENQKQFYFFEFYTKNLNVKSLNIPDSNLLSNKTNFYCYLLFIFDSKEEFNSKDSSTNNIINMLSSRNTPKELSHLLIICNKNLDLSFITNILDKNTYNIINTWENNNIKKNHKEFENVLKNILIKYRINAVNQKLYIDQKIEEDLKIKKNLEILDSYIKIGNYQKSIEYLRELKRSFKLPKVLALFNECQVLVNFLIDYNNSFIKGDNKMEYKKEIENGFLDAIEDYRYINQVYLMVNAYLKLLYYLSYFNTIEMKQNINDIIYNLLDEKMDDDSKSKMFSNISFLIYLNLSHVFNKIHFKRKFFLLLFRAYKDYLNNYKINELYGNLSYIDLLIKNIEKYFLKDNTKIEINYYNYNYETYLQFCNIIKKSHYNPMNFIFVNNNELKQENFDNNYLQKGPLSINGIFKGYHKVFHHIIWDLIQKKIYNILMKYYKGIKNYDKTILFSLELLQICYDILPIEKQTKFVNIIQKKSSKIKYINSFNSVNIPILLKIIPQPSDIKFDCISQNEDKGDDLFIFNPWSKKNENNINYYWTLNSIQSIIIIVYNPLSIEITLNEVKLLYNIKNKNSDNNNLFNFIPCSVIIPPQQRIEYKFKFKPLFEEIFDIIGIEYFFQGVKLKQYIKETGNGILFRYKNTLDDLYNSSKKDYISLNNIRIYPEVPLVKLIPLNNELIEDNPLSFFIFQKYTFNFDIFNLSDKPIKQINVAVYAYKKVDYKISLYETILKSPDNQIKKAYLEPNKRKKFSYDFIQKKNYIKIEFILYYIYDEENNKNQKQNIIKPFLFFKKDLNYRNLFSFSNPEINPVYTNINFKKILALEKNYSRYFTSIISNNFYLSFALKLLFLSNKKVLFEVFSLDKNENKDSLLDKGEFTKNKNFKIFVDKSRKISKTYIYWKIEENKIEGIINCFDLLRNIFNKDIEQNFDFDIIKNVKEDYIEFIYNIQNNTKFSYYNMKVKILLYQEDTKNINMSISLQDDIFVDGQLIHMIDEIKPREKISVPIRLYAKKGTIFNTTFLLIDQKSGVLYMPSFSVNHM